MYRKDRSQAVARGGEFPPVSWKMLRLGRVIIESWKSQKQRDDLRACTTERRPRRLPSYVMKYDDPNLIDHGERAKPSLLPSTAKARAPMQSYSSKHPLYELLRYASAMRIPCKESLSGPGPWRHKSGFCAKFRSDAY